MEELLKLSYEEEVSIDTRDINGDTPLELACIRGFDGSQEESFTREDGYVVSRRFKVAQQLLEYVNKNGEQEITIEYRKLKKGLNSPLHWAIYWTDIDLAELVYKECQEQIFWVNKHDMIPFDMSSEKETKFLELKSKLVKITL
jgi:ankyrin repeat protein